MNGRRYYLIAVAPSDTIMRFLLAAFITSAAATGQATTWTKLAPANSPPSRGSHAMAYDAARGQAVLFGGYDSSKRLNDTWTWDGKDWKKQSPSNVPSPRTSFAMAYHAGSQRVILFGGQGDQSMLGDTWAWDGSNWQQLAPSSSPTPRSDYVMAYDAGRQRIVLFGGRDSARRSDTWEWDGQTWLPIFWVTTFPSARNQAGMCYDSVAKVMVLFGGRADSGPVDDTWTWDGTAWSLAQPVNRPPRRTGHAMAYHQGRKRAVAFGGSDIPNPLSDTWEWDGRDWTKQAPPQSPLAGSGAAFVFDERLGKLLLSQLSDTWTYDSLPPTARLTPFGAGCGPSPVVALSSSSTPRIGLPLALDTTNARPTATAGILALGLSRTNLGPFTLPLSLAGFGMPGCTLYQSHDVLFVFAISGWGRYTLAIPNDGELLRRAFYLQSYVIDVGVNLPGVLTTNGLEAVIGA